MHRHLLFALFVTFAAHANAQLVLPYAGTDPGATISSFQIVKAGTAGRANTLYITNANNASEALFASTAGLGKAGLFTINNAANSTQALRGESNGSGVGIFGLMTGTGRAGSFRIINPSNTRPALHAETDGSGPALLLQAGTGLAADLQGKLRIAQVGPSQYGNLEVSNGEIVNVSPGGAVRAATFRARGSGYVVGTNSYAESTDSAAWAIRGTATGDGTNYGVYGNAGHGTTNYAGYFDGLLYAASSSSGVKAFLIDHPTDPENKVLVHSSVESDERMNLYRGVTTTDSRGYAWIAVPGWFNALNKNIQYQLTVVDTQDSDDFILAKVVKELSGQQFKIRTSAPRVKVNWMISGVRHDPTSNYYPLEVERMKNKDEKGKYYVPGAFGKDPSFGMGYLPSAQQSEPQP